MFPSSPLLELVSQPFKRAQLGLFQGKTKQYGNNVPFSKHKSRRTWLPNVQRKRLFSEAIGDFVRVKATTRALKTVKKYGGLDNYVLKSRSEILGQKGMDVRVQVRAAQESAKKAAELMAREEREARILAETPMDRLNRFKRELRKPPTIETVRLLREEAAKALAAKTPLASSEQTLQYLANMPSAARRFQREQLKREKQKSIPTPSV